MPSGTPDTPRPKQQSSLVALASAAVLTVYSAGFMRTKPAADRFAAEAEARKSARKALPEPAGMREKELGPRRAHRPQLGAGAQASAPTLPPLQRTAPASTPVPSAKKPESTAAAAQSPTIRAIFDSSGTTATTAPAAPSPSTTAPAEPAPPVAAAKTDSATAPARKFNDGSYTGWGTSRHGDIQAEVVIKDGRIVEAKIIQCLTRYSCSWISPLPPQVIARQSPEVDYVSGATESTNAFYSAVREALNYAR